MNSNKDKNSSISNNNKVAEIKDNLYKEILSKLDEFKTSEFTTADIAAKFNLNYYVVATYLNKYVIDGILVEIAFNTFKFNSSKVSPSEKPGHCHFGNISIHDKGYGFVVSKQNKNKYFIPPNQINNSINGDLVRFSIFKDQQRNEDIAKVEEVISRKNDKLVVIAKPSSKNPKEIYLISDKNSIAADKIKLENKSSLQPNHKIVLKIINSHNGILDCEFYKDLGHINDKYVDIYSKVYESNIPVDFSVETIKYCKSLKLEDADLKDRNDISKQLFVTIDGDDSKDFDDAISITKVDNKFKLSVAIADVAHYVQENSSLDFDALKRGTSVYLIDVVVPMLPYELSNDLCSLNPNTKKLAINVDMIINEKGQVEKYEFTNAVIISKHRLTYKEVNEFIKSGLKTSLKNDNDLTSMMKDAYELFQLLSKVKSEKGMISFQSEEAKLKLDEQGKTCLVSFYEHGEAEALIEQFMVIANECAAEFLSAASKKINGLFRVHAAPQSKKAEAFDKIAKIFNLDKPEHNKLTNKFFQKIIKDVADQPNKYIINLYLLRSLEKAKYDYKNIGHFGLASKCYTHFTSPIRRYPDLIVHRLIKLLLADTWQNNFSKNRDVMEEIASQSNFCELRAVDCELSVIKMKKAEFLQNYLKYDFDGVIVSVNKFGFFVELDNTIEGLVHISSLVDDEYEFNQEKLELVGKEKHRTFKLGDNVKITIFNIVKHKGKIDFILTDLKDKQPVQQQSRNFQEGNRFNNNRGTGSNSNSKFGNSNNRPPFNKFGKPEFKNSYGKPSFNSSGSSSYSDRGDRDRSQQNGNRKFNKFNSTGNSKNKNSRSFNSFSNKFDDKFMNGFNK